MKLQLTKYTTLLAVRVNYVVSIVNGLKIIDGVITVPLYQTCFKVHVYMQPPLLMMTTWLILYT